jgi:hypothetical protein
MHTAPEPIADFHENRQLSLVWGVYRRVFTHFRLTLPGQNVKREKLCFPNAHYERLVTASALLGL